MNEPLQTTLADVVRLLGNEGIAFALIGGQATSLRGQERVTADIDIVLATDVANALKLVAKLPQTNFEPLFADVSDVVQRSFILPLRHRVTHIKVDLAVGLSGFEQQTVTRAEPIDVGGCILRVATAEDLLIMKVLAGRPRDEEDIRGLVLVQGALIDWNYCESTAAALGNAIGIDLISRVRAFRNL